MNLDFDSLLANVLAWSAQIGVLVAVAALAALTLTHPRARLLFWQGVLAIALLLPAVEPWVQPAPAHGGVILVTPGPAAIHDSAPERFRLSWRAEYLLGWLAGGAVLRMLWIGVGLLRLRRHRLAARALSDPPIPFERQHVNWYVSDTVSGPVTFGWARPAILLPSRLNRLTADLREAIACHELVHVERRDWLFVLAEELIRSLLWFHPMIWFALSRIQLSREQVVDLEVVQLTSNSERYLDALLAVAAQKWEPDVAPAPLFLKRRQLAARVAAVLKEARMSKPRMVISVATVSSAALVAARLAVWFFPLESAPLSAAQTDYPDSAGVTVDAGAKLMHRVPVLHAGIAGTVTLEATLNAKGEVVDARVISGPDELRRYALQSVLQWHYSTDPAPPSPVRIAIRFDPPAAPVHSALAQAPAVTPLAARKRQTAILKTIEIQTPSPEIEQKVRNVLPVREGDEITSDTMPKVLAAAQQVDEHFTGNMAISATHEANIRLILGVATALPINRAPEGVALRASEEPAMVPPQRLRIGGNVQAANLITKVTPAYPPDAKAARVQGVVRFTAVIGKDGTIQSLELVDGQAMLVPTATEAVKQWVYRPTLLNGNPVEVITQIDVNFTVTQ